MAGTETDGDRPDAEASDGARDDYELPVIEPDHYTIRGEVARGGMGKILEAFDERLGRPVAIKQLLRSTEELRLMFEREALITARLQHPSIVSIYEAGRVPNGEPFYSMKLVTGRSLKEVVAGAKSLAERLALLPSVIAVCDALAYAHQQRIVHRDLKPSNVLLGEFGETVVVDWGLARDLALAPEEGEPVRGTPAFMAPEQARGEAADERADVYSLGSMLYFLLAGEPAYHEADAKVVLEHLEAGPPDPLDWRQGGVPRDLCTIVDKAMSRSPAERYPTAKELVEELRRFQTGQLVSAHRYSMLDRLRRWVARHRGAVAVGVAALVVLAVVSVVAIRRVVRERDIAASRADRLTLARARQFLGEDPTAAVATLTLLSADSPGWSAARVVAADARARGVARVLEGHVAPVVHVVFAPTGDSVASSSRDGEVLLWNARDGTRRAIGRHSAAVTALVFSPDGRWLASAGQDRLIALRQTSAPDEPRLVEMPLAILSLAFAPDSGRLAAADSDGTIHVIDVEAAGEVAKVLRGHRAPVTHLAYSADGSTLASASHDGSVRLWRDSAEDAVVVLEDRAPIGALAYSSRGQLAAGLADGAVRVWEPSFDASRILLEDQLAAGEEGSIERLAFSPDGRRLSVLAAGGTVRLWDADTGELAALEQSGPINALAFSPDGTVVATGGRDRKVGVWLSTGALSRDLSGHRGRVTGVAFSADGSLLASASEDRAVRIWNLREVPARRFDGHVGLVSRVAFAVGGTLLVSTGRDASVRVVELASGKARALRGHAAPISDLAISPDGERAVSCADDGTLRSWDLTGDDHFVVGRHGGIPLAVAFSPDGKQVVSGGRDSAVRIWGSDGGAEVLSGHSAAVVAVAFAPDGQQVASASEDGDARLWEPGGDDSRRLAHGDLVTDVAFSPRGNALATACRDGVVRIWHSTGELARELRGHSAAVRRIAFSSDGTWLVSVGDDMDAWLWRLSDGEGRVLRGHEDFVVRAVFSPDGGRLLTASEDGTARLWDLRSGTSRVLPHGSRLSDVAFSPDGNRAASAGAGGIVRVWRDDLPLAGHALRRQVRALASGLSPYAPAE